MNPKKSDPETIDIHQEAWDRLVRITSSRLISLLAKDLRDHHRKRSTAMTLRESRLLADQILRDAEQGRLVAATDKFNQI